MKITNINKILGPELTPLLTAGKKEGSIKKKSVVKNLLALPISERTQRIDQFVNKILACDDDAVRCDFVAYLEKRVSPHDVSSQSKKALDLFRKGIAFPNELFPVVHFDARAKDENEMQRVFERIKANTRKVEKTTPHIHADDVKNQDRRPRTKSYPYDFNRTGRELEVYLNASDVTLADGQEYILGSCPYNPTYTQELFHALLLRNTSVMVSLHQKHERNIESMFWRQSALEKLQLADGWKATLDRTKTTTVYESEECPAQVIERTITLTKDAEVRTIKHLHYVGWEDSKPAPCETTLIALLQRADEIGGKIWINCKGGNGRTGELAAIHWGKRKIDVARLKGIPADQIALNIPEMIAELRNQRRCIISKPSQLAQVYTTLGKYLTKV